MPHGKRGKGKRPLMLDIKLRHIGPKKPTREDVKAVLEHMLATGGEVPEFWQFAAIDWSHPGKGTHGFRVGTVGNFAQFSKIIEAKLDSLKMSIDRRPQP